MTAGALDETDWSTTIIPPPTNAIKAARNLPQQVLLRPAATSSSRTPIGRAPAVITSAASLRGEALRGHAAELLEQAPLRGEHVETVHDQGQHGPKNDPGLAIPIDPA